MPRALGALPSSPAALRPPPPALLLAGPAARLFPAPALLRTGPAALRLRALALLLAGPATLLLVVGTAHAGERLDAPEDVQVVEACLADRSACRALPDNTPLGLALRTGIGDPSGYQAFGVLCQEHDDCAGLAAFSAARCALQDPEGCATLGTLHESGLLDGPRPVVAAALFARACAHGSEDHCGFVGLPPVGSIGEALDADLAALDLIDPVPLSLLLAACDAGASDACLALIRQLDADGPDSDSRAVLVQLLDGEAQRGRASASDLLRTLRWLDDPLPDHLWAVAGPLADACRQELPHACALGRAILHLERASGRPPPSPALLDNTVAESPPPTPDESPRWVELILPLGAGASFSTATPLLHAGFGVRAGWAALSFSAVLGGSFDATHAPAEALYRRFVAALGIGAAIPLGPPIRLHIEGGLGLGSRRTTADAEFAIGPRESLEFSWLVTGRRGATLGFRVSSHQAWTPSGTLDVTGAVSVVVGLRMPD